MASDVRTGATRGPEWFTRADFLRRLALVGLSAGVTGDVLSACSSAIFEPSGSAVPPTPARSLTWAVRLLAPSGGIDSVVLRAFTRRTGVAVSATTPARRVTLSEALSGEAYDVVLVPDRLVSVLAGESLLLPLDMMAVRNFEYVQGAFRAPPYDYGDPARYSVPFHYKTLGLAVRPDALYGVPRRWADLWQPSFRRRVWFEVRGRPVIGIGLLSLGLPLGSTCRREVDQAVARLIALRENLLPRPCPGDGGAPVTVCWSPQALKAARSEAGEDPRFVLPADGFEIDTAALCVARATSNALAAHAFLDFCLRPGVQRGVAERHGTQSTEPEAYRYLPPLERSFARSSLQLVRGQWADDLGPFSELYDRAWAAVARKWALAA